MNGPTAERKSPASPRDFIWTWLPTILYGGVILLWAMQPAPRLPRIKHVDKYAHMLVYGLLSVLAYRSLVRSGSRHPAVRAVCLSLSVGIADEGMQFLGGVRSADWFDVIADGAGALMAMTAVMLCRRRGGAPGTGAS